MVVYNKHLKIALLTDALFSDAGWGAFAYNAAQAIKTKYGHEVDFTDNVAITNIEATLRDYAHEGYDLIIAHGFEWGDPAVKVGKDYPNTKFVVFTGLAKSTNVASIFPPATGRILFVRSTCWDDVKNRCDWLCWWRRHISKPHKHF